MDVIDLNAERRRREQPDAEFVGKDEYERPLYCFGVQYEFGGSSYTIQLWAYSWEDAETKVAALRESATVYGQLFSQVPA